MNDSCYSWVPLGFANVFICKRSHTHLPCGGGQVVLLGGRLYSNARTHTHTHLPCGGGQVVLLGGRLYSNARTHSVAVEDMVEAVKQGLPNALLFRFVFAAHGVSCMSFPPSC